MVYGSVDVTSDFAGGLMMSDAVRVNRPISCTLSTGAGVVDSWLKTSIRFTQW